MKKSVAIIVGIIVLLGAVGAGAYFFLTSPTKGPSRPPMQPLAAVSTTTAESVSTTVGEVRYAIIPDQSSARFVLDEQLRGEPKTVVGTSTGFIAGEFGYDTTNPVSSTIGVIKINARTFVTDDKGRNNMIRRAILKTEDDANEFITFKPTSIIESKAEGTDALPGGLYEMSGDLTIAGVTKPVTFNVSMLKEGEQLTIGATATVKRSDFNLVIPNIPFIADVTDEVKLELNLVAKPVTQ